MATSATHSSVRFPQRSTTQLLVESAISGPRSLGGASLRKLHRPTAFFVALVWGISVVLAFSLLLWQAATTSRYQRVLSLDQNVAGSSCEEVPLPITGTFEGSIDGYWQTHPAFQANRSAFVLELAGAELTLSQYENTMHIFADKLKELNSKFQYTNVLLNNLAWATYSFRQGPLVFRSNSDLGIMFDMQVNAAFLASRSGSCQYRTSTLRSIGGTFPARYDKALSRISLRFPVQLIPNFTLSTETPDQYCPAQGQWIARNENKGFSPRTAQFAGGSAEFSFNIESMVLVVSLNLGIANTDTLLEVRSQASEANGLIGYLHPGRTHDPIYCLDKNAAQRIYNIQLTQVQFDGPPVCFLIDSFHSRTLYMFYPWMNQIAYDESARFFPHFAGQKGCTCPQDQRVLGCNMMERWWLSFFYDSDFEQKRTIEFGIRQLNVYLEAGSKTGGMALINSLTNLVVFSSEVVPNQVAKRGPVVSFTDPSTGKFFDNSWANNLTLNQLITREFDKNCPTCGAIIFHLSHFLARTNFYFPINRNGLSAYNLLTEPQIEYITVNQDTSRKFDLPPTQATLLNGTRYPYLACQDTLSQSKAMSRLAQQPPVDLINAYFSCRKSWFQAISSSIGASAASTNLYIFIAWVLLGMLCRKFYPVLYGKFYPTDSRLERLVDAEREIERSALVDVVESLGVIADELKDRGTSSAVAAATGLHSKISNYTRLFKRAESGTESEEKRRQLLGALITEKLYADIEQPASLTNASYPAAKRRITLSLPSEVDVASAQAANSGFHHALGQRCDYLTSHPLGMVLSSSRPPERLAYLAQDRGAGEKRRSATSRGSFVGATVTGVHTL